MAKDQPEAKAANGHLFVWRLVSIVVFAANLLVGVGYVFAQLRAFGTVEDGLFIFLILLNTAIAGLSGFHFEKRLRNLVTAFNKQDIDEADKMEIGRAFRSIFNTFWAVPYALGHAAFIAVWVYLLAPWSTGIETDPQLGELNVLLTLFLFTGNLMIGYGIFCIGRFWLLAARRIRQIRLDILNTTRPDIAIYQDINKRIVILVAFVATLAILSLPDSKISLGETAMLFSIAALATVAATYLVPMLPLTEKFHETRVEALDEIEKKMHATYAATLAADDPKPLRAKLDEYNALREQVRKVKTLPPGGEFSIFTAFGVSLLTFVPTILEQVLNFTGLVSAP